MEKIQALPPEQIPEVEDFVALIAAREQDRALIRAAAAASAPVVAAVWDSPDDDAQDAILVRRCRAGAVRVHQSSRFRPG